METAMAAEAVGLPELIGALEQATQMAKQLPNASDPSQIHQFYSSFQQAHHQLSLFLSLHPNPPSPPPPPPPTANGDEVVPMQVGDGDEEEEDFKRVSVGDEIEGVEKRIRGWFIQNKRLKRPLSPSAVAAAEEEQDRRDDLEGVGKGGSVSEFDPQATKQRSLDLINQFHC